MQSKTGKRLRRKLTEAMQSKMGKRIPVKRSVATTPKPVKLSVPDVNPGKLPPERRRPKSVPNEKRA